MNGARWTPEDDAVLTLEASEGVSYGRIAEHLGRSRTAVLQRSRIIGADYRRRRWAAREDDDLRKAIAAGTSYRDLADLHVRTRNALRIRAHQLGLTSRPKENA